MTTIDHSDYGERYDWNALGPWLQEQGAEPTDVQSITVHTTGKVTLHQYDRDENGRLYTVGNDVAMRPPRRIRPTRPIPLLP